ncbi:hypothetical protein [Streptomyces ehimensis]|uniref:Uncharacterized protein n=1 Tax=Streptomyces ehimensis TaxID=68195 RepID=A0ABV9BW85_9ACTN
MLGDGAPVVVAEFDEGGVSAGLVHLGDNAPYFLVDCPGEGVEQHVGSAAQECDGGELGDGAPGRLHAGGELPRAQREQSPLDVGVQVSRRRGEVLDLVRRYRNGRHLLHGYSLPLTAPPNSPKIVPSPEKPAIFVVSRASLNSGFSGLAGKMRRPKCANQNMTVKPTTTRKIILK